MKRVLTFLVFFACAGILTAQSLKELSPAMEYKFKELGEDKFSIFVSAPLGVLLEMEKAGTVRLVGSVDGYQLIRTNVYALRSLLFGGNLNYIDIPFSSASPMNDLMITNNNILPLHQGLFPVDSALTGEGVIIGIIDTGVEMGHPDFQKEDGSTRILEIWDHTFEYDADHVPEPYGFGTLWTQEEIDSGLAQHLDQPQWNGHGSTVTGTACGDGSAVDNFKGVAPSADMVIVSFDFDRPNFLADVAQSVQYVFELAEANDKPAVVNLSLGDYYGSHDGLDPAALYIDSLLEVSPGRIAVAAAGNSNAIDPYHLRVDLDEDTAFTWFQSESNLGLGTGGVFFELWADTVAFSNLEFQMGADKIFGGYSVRGNSPWKHYTEVLGEVVAEPIVNGQEDTLGIAQYWAQTRGGQVQLQVYVQDPDSSTYAYRFMAGGTGSYDVWSTSVFGTSDMIQLEEIPSSDDFPPISRYVAPDKLKQMVSSFTCSDKVITVGNYTNRVSYENYLGETTTVEGTPGEIYITSSAGPTRDGRVKPDIAATGSLTLSAGNFPMIDQLIAIEPHKVAAGGMHIRNGGTSMASPVVAGLAALYLEQCPEADYQSFKEDVLSTAAVDDFVGQVPNPYWGMGKVNGFGAVAAHSLVAEITSSGDSIYANGGTSYQWYLDGIALVDETDNFILAQSDGSYQVEAFNMDGCSDFSENYLYTDVFDGLSSSISIVPNPTRGRVEIRGLIGGEDLRLIDTYGRELMRGISAAEETMSLDLSSYSHGLYFLELGFEGQRKYMRIIKD